MSGIKFNKQEMILMMLYNTGSRTGLITELKSMQTQLTGRERKLRSLTVRVLEKLERMTDAAFEELDLYPDLELEEGGDNGNKA